MRLASVIARAERLDETLHTAADQLVEALGGEMPDLLLAFAGTHYAQFLSRLPELLAREIPGVPVVGCSASGVIGGGAEVETARAIAVAGAVLPKVEVTPFHVDPADLPAPGGPAEAWQATQ